MFVSPDLLTMLNTLAATYRFKQSHQIVREGNKNNLGSKELLLLLFIVLAPKSISAFFKIKIDLEG